MRQVGFYTCYTCILENSQLPTIMHTEVTPTSTSTSTPSAVRAEERKDLAELHVEGNAGNSREIAEGLDEILHLDDRAGGEGIRVQSLYG